MDSGTANDLTQGLNVTIIGTTNQDGSITTESIQIRPDFQATSTAPVTQ